MDERKGERIFWTDRNQFLSSRNNLRGILNEQRNLTDLEVGKMVGEMSILIGGCPKTDVARSRSAPLVAADSRVLFAAVRARTRLT